MQQKKFAWERLRNLDLSSVYTGKETLHVCRYHWRW
jgi:hypothetical protein